MVNGPISALELGITLIDAQTLLETGAPNHYNGTGKAGQIAFDGNHLYFCTEDNIWIKLPGTKNF